MSAKILLLGVVFAGLLSACVSMQQPVTGLEPTPEQKAADRIRLEAAWSAFTAGEPELAYSEFKKFRKERPQTIFETEAQFGEARSLEEMGEWTLALKIYREIVSERLGNHPGIATMAMFYRASSAEALGDESQMLASLRDAEKNQSYLPDEIRLAALPARLSVALMKVGQEQEARAELHRADQGITQLRAQGLAPEKWARLYYEMGSISTNQLVAENFQSHLDSFSGGQIFLLKAIEAGIIPWSDRALQSLQGHYRDFWNLAVSPPVSQSLDAGARERMKIELQSRWLGEISRMINQLKLNQRPGVTVLAPQEEKLWDFLAQLEAQTQAHLLDPGSVLPLTPESQKRQSLKKEGTIRSEAVFPAEKKRPIPPSSPLPSHQDPNLKTEPNRGH